MIISPGHHWSAFSLGWEEKWQRGTSKVELASWDLTPNIIKSIQLYKFAPVSREKRSHQLDYQKHWLSQRKPNCQKNRESSKKREKKKCNKTSFKFKKFLKESRWPRKKESPTLNLRNSCWWCGCAVASRSRTKIAFIAFTPRVTSTLLLVTHFYESRAILNATFTFGKDLIRPVFPRLDQSGKQIGILNLLSSISYLHLKCHQDILRLLKPSRLLNFPTKKK